jgi:D-alanyl-D-alanine carboxypeptidase/D-alanyl-D-alanine-endopeptidase (penicillin-binding protein 4)
MSNRSIINHQIHALQPEVKAHSLIILDYAGEDRAHRFPEGLSWGFPFAMRFILLLCFVTGMWPPAVADDSTEILHKDLDKIFSDSRFADAQWGVEVFSLDRSELLYEKNPQRLYIPASNNKILTAVAALIRLGPDYHFETRLLMDGSIEKGVLKGNLIILGSGDPTISPNFQSENPFGVFTEWAGKLKEQNIRSISGDILGDTGAFDEDKFGKGWEWDDLVQAYAAPISALQYNDNSITVEIIPGSSKGNPASVRTSPLSSYLTIENRVVTETKESPAAIRIKPGDSIESIVISGSVPSHGPVITRTVAVQSPVRYYLSALKQALSEQGIDTASCAIRERRDQISPNLSLLWSHSSPQLSEILKPLLKTSQNLYAETLTRTLGSAILGEGTFDKGKEVLEETLNWMGVKRGSYSYADASGLSRLNLASADTLVCILRYIYRHQYFEDFYNALPVAGVDGTLAARLKGTKAENNLHAKTGTIANVSSISGYLRTAEGEMLAFSMIANNFLVSRDVAEDLQNKAIERLANFSRK